MTTFSVLGDDDPFLHVSMQQGDKIYCESDAMVMMESNLELKGRMTGGLGSALLRQFANGENFFQQHIEAVKGGGDCLLAPTLPGAIEILDIGQNQYILADGAFVAATSGVEMKVKMQSIGNALFASSGGFVVMTSSGQGQLVVSGFGSIFTLEVVEGKEVVIDNGHVIAWDANLRYTLGMATSKTGFLSGVVNAATSGEGVILRFSGGGKVLVCSRNRENFLRWAAAKSN
ncbi:MAG: TIGR00266 family protein [Halothiobacillaceae bacterium]